MNIISAVADADKQTFSIAAALASPSAKEAVRLLARAQIPLPEGRITAGHIDRQLSASGLSVVERIALKNALARAGILVE